ncbi:hypothetical protein MIMGU_mgv1a015727mg [Erythranthe guttata]|uniref:Uncharacterized protein n=1 Tax=Erythranthe guttata TaxID=4155 RepID=A0A022RGX2_ERYGU|nr:hypothetical protein MIMGU_mgv1a015727mg [Erythranthe guttata]
MHTDDLEICTQTNEPIIVQKGSEENEKNQHVSALNSHPKTGQGKGLQEVEALTATGASAKKKGPKKNVTFKEDDKKEANNNNNLISADEEAKKANGNGGSHEETKEKPPRHWGPLLSVASNINEKSDAFINRKKKAMRRNYTLDSEKS